MKTCWEISISLFSPFRRCGEITLGYLNIKSFENGNGPRVSANGSNQELPLADVPIPQNIKNFESIVIRFVFTIKICINKIIIKQLRPIRHCISARISAKFSVGQCESAV
jgi:hypothetical protein